MGCYVGLRPKQSESGQSQPQLRITKEGDRYLRKLLVQGAHCILRQRAPDTDLKRWGLKLAERGGKNAKEASDCGGGAQTGDAAAPVVGRRAKCTSRCGTARPRRFPTSGLKEMLVVLSEPNRRVRVTARSRRNGSVPATEAIQFGSEMAAPVYR